MKPEVWGPHAWIFLHSVTFDYPDNPSETKKEQYKVFFESLQNVLPCEICRNHYQENLKRFPINKNVLKSRKNLIEWLIDIHNSVNQSNNKSKLKYQDVVKKYLDYYEGKDFKDPPKCVSPSISSNIVVIISILLMTLFILKKRIFLK
tara:strand:+ start:375 stop:818 length:444 start_codon:yes stop_codon:yes gene_type:complete